MNASHPSKEQVRAYLALRGHAHLPPPSPEEIRRRLNWGADHGQHDVVSVLLLPPTLLQLSALMAVSWLFLPFLSRKMH
jgi:hypothetical protein